MTFPPFCKDSDFKLLMQQMLTKSPMSRFSKLSQIQSHVWFNNFNWEELGSLHITPPFIPQIKNSEIKKGPSYVKYIKQNCKEWEPEKELVFDEKNSVLFKKWHEQF